jgi:hypothetical protein
VGGQLNKLAHSCGGPGNQLYERKHNPFVAYADVQSSPSRMAKVVDLSQLDADLASGTSRISTSRLPTSVTT